MTNIAELVKNKHDIIKLKKATIKHCDVIEYANTDECIEVKGINYANTDDETSLKRMIVANTYNWMDSHDDVHLNGVFTKSINESKHKVMHLHDHLYQVDAKVGEVIDVMEKQMNWTDLGVQKEGTTTSLLIYSDIQKDYNNKIFNQYLKKKINQHSVGMIYTKIDMAVNDKKYPDEYQVWLKNIDKIANKEKAIEKGYFFAVHEAKLIEVSAVLKGSNELTPTIEPQKENEPDNTHNENDKAKELDLTYILKNFKL